jgi:hypothetical protein
MREEADRLDELQQRQLRFAEYSWRPAVQGGGRRSDGEKPAEPEDGADTD